RGRGRVTRMLDGLDDWMPAYYTRMAELLGTTVDHLFLGREAESAAQDDPRDVNVDIHAEPASDNPNAELERTVLLLARHMGYKQAIDRLVLYRVEPHPGADPRLTGETMPPPGAARNGRTGDGG